MDGATIQARIYAGRGKAALRIGLDCRQYRPLTAAAPLGNLLATIKAAFNSGDSNYLAPNLYGDPVWYADLDGRVTQTSDYLVRVSDGSTWFIAAQQQLLPIVCVDCNRAVRISRQSLNASVGAQAYGSTSPCDPTSMSDIVGAPGALWPASILMGGRKDAATGLPGGVKNAGWKMLLPPSVPVVLKAGDIATDDLGRRYAIDAAELTDMGWRLAANEVHS
jgi:hypothetical protein